MTEWEKLPDRTTPDGQTLYTDRTIIDGEVWYHGTIPAPAYVPKHRRTGRLLCRLGFHPGWREYGNSGEYRGCTRCGKIIGPDEARKEPSA